jgi:LPXTG-motif cell wall-anchored protein
MFQQWIISKNEDGTFKILSYRNPRFCLTTGEDGRAVSPNLDCGTYFVLETKAPDGYKLPEEAVSVTVVSNALTSHVVLEVANERGAIMPETGGIGTTIFLVVGGILAVGAAILLVTKKRMNSGEEE